MRSNRNRHLLSLALLVALMSAATWAAPKSAINTGRDRLALQGYDAVAYSTDGRPVKGSLSYEYRWKDAVWRFASATNRDRFAKDPAHYAPEFGGYCAYAVSRGTTADGDPTVWRIVDGHLYLNYSTQVQKLWEEDVPGNIVKGRGHWPGVLSK